MGRYYSGDIEGKFWFAVQDSSDADNFGVYGEDMKDEDGNDIGYLSYEFNKKDIPKIDEGIQRCINELGEHKGSLEYFFNEGGPGYMGYSDDMINKHLGMDSDGKTQRLLEIYARLKLGEQILECVKTKGSCKFQAEL